MNIYFKEEENTEFHESIYSMNYFFLLEKNKWNFTSDLSQANIVLCSLRTVTNAPSLANRLNPDQIVLVWHLETSSDAVTPNQLRELVFKSAFYKKHKRMLFVHTNELDINDPQFICHSIMFNRQKLYFTQYREDWCSNKQWSERTPAIAYTISEIKKEFSKNNKTFLVANRIKMNTEHLFEGFKAKLSTFMSSLNANMHYGDPAKNIFLKYNGWKQSDYHKPGGPLFAPIGDYYYNTSYVSVGIETLVSSHEIFYPCEKYYNHLIKGNFPLIFSVPGSIKKLKSIYGFKFPNWIDYSYDTIDDANKRFNAFKKSIKDVSIIPLEELHQLYVKDKHILEHNRNVFFTKPYDSLYDKVEKSIRQLGW